MTGTVEVPEGFEKRMRPYGAAVHQVFYRLQIARDVADILANGRAVTTDFIDYESCWWQLLTSCEQLADALARFRGLSDRELVFAGPVPDWPLPEDEFLPAALGQGDGSYFRDGALSLSRRELQAVRERATSALQFKPIHIFSDRQGARELSDTAEQMRSWLLQHVLVLPELKATAIFRTLPRDMTCSLVPIAATERWAGAPGVPEDTAGLMRFIKYDEGEGKSK